MWNDSFILAMLILNFSQRQNSLQQLLCQHQSSKITTPQAVK